jgi:hypothetical protein
MVGNNKPEPATIAADFPSGCFPFRGSGSLAVGNLRRRNAVASQIAAHVLSPDSVTF